MPDITGRESETVNLASALAELGWSKGDLARRLGRHRNAVAAWGDDPPVYVTEYLRLALKMRRLAKELDDL